MLLLSSACQYYHRHHRIHSKKARIEIGPILLKSAFFNCVLSFLSKFTTLDAITELFWWKLYFSRYVQLSTVFAKDSCIAHITFKQGAWYFLLFQKVNKLKVSSCFSDVLFEITPLNSSCRDKVNVLKLLEFFLSWRERFIFFLWRACRQYPRGLMLEAMEEAHGSFTVIWNDLFFDVCRLFFHVARHKSHDWGHETLFFRRGTSMPLIMAGCITITIVAFCIFPLTTSLLRGSSNTNRMTSANADWTISCCLSTARIFIASI